MVTRLLDASSTILLNMDKNDLMKSIKLSEGRVILSEIITEGALFNGISNAEIAASFGADLLLLNLYDVNKPHFRNIRADNKSVIRRIKEYTGRPIGINLEPVDETIGEMTNLPEGRKASLETALKAYQQGVDFIVLTGNPLTGVTAEKIVNNIKKIKAELGNKVIIMAGKMHTAGVEEDYLAKEMFDEMISAGVDVILLPVPGSVPGISLEECKQAVGRIKQNGVLVMTTLGTSQEGVDKETIKKLALNSKMVGADIHHIGDAGMAGMALPENIMTYSITVRGIRHTYKRMALSIKR
ncbi:MAG: haloacid dehalogenase-like hydrolase [Firmicutes bacterium]|nr:haloacid dehalogenase-like hydrolase [Bacillota bacterium]